MSVASKRARRKESHRKFLLGLSFEKAGLALQDNHYLESEKADEICRIALDKIEQNASIEHSFYQSGQAAFNSKIFMDNKDSLESIQILLGETWKQQRYHHLVRLGGDVLRSGLAEYPKATILGALFCHKETVQPSA